MSDQDKGGWLPHTGPIFVENKSGKPVTIHRNSVAIRQSHEEIYRNLALRYPEFNRKIAQRIERPPTDEQWAEYHRVKAAWEIVQESEYFDHGCSCEHPSIKEPETRIEYVYAETHEEWMERCLNIQIREQ